VNELEITEALKEVGEYMDRLLELESQRIVRALIKGYMKLLIQQINN